MIGAQKSDGITTDALAKRVSPSYAQSDEGVVRWYPMRVTYNRELRVNDCLKLLDIETFLPTRQQLVERGGKRRYEEVPLVHNLLFVHSSRQVITGLKMTRPEFNPLRYIMTRPLNPNESPRVMNVPDRQMENFIRVASADADRLMFLDYAAVSEKVGRRVIITDGDFAGVEGVVKRIKKNRHVVVELDGLTAVAIAFVPPAFLRFIDE